jgi:ABC-type antimicrobial peptide transport system permease subunit
VRQHSLRAPAAPGIYRVGSAWSGVVTTLYVRSARPPAEITDAIRDILATTEPGTSLFAERMLEDRVRDATSDARYVTMLLLAFGALAALLAAIGVYGVLAWSVVQRRREFGVRLAVGARPGELVTGVLREGAGLLVGGVVLGLLLALVGTRVLRAFLYEIEPGDPLTLTIVAVGLALIGLTASLIPAVRAGRTDPLVIMRDGV